ncbi:MAG: zinc-binding dehydrogenase [SAR202 cluster bacterium]|jgi:(R,R)-butanediol dehydrogenase/meso-butanediol dehydrogenase/diacetyl reductase|nr:alcohol dehydrogenase catalytic domain-containing protein [SAR202 cluster bacterium]MQG58957.1 zinc-binding dehydrogenase [SAR202 cluster bacterium]
MKALVYHGNKDLRLETVPEPKPGPGQVKLDIEYCGICATDIEEYLYGPVFISSDSPNPVTGRKMPLTTGHEVVATVAELGHGVTDPKVGDRVVLNGVLTCRTCRWCRLGETSQCPSMAAIGFAIDGGLADSVVWPAEQTVVLPANVSSKEAALVEPASVAVHAVRRSAASAGDRVAVIGAGTVGLLALQALKAQGAEVFAVDTRQMSLDLAAELGADAVVNPDAQDARDTLAELTEGIGPDIVIDAAGAATTPELAVGSVRRGGLVLLVAIYTSTPRFDFNSLVAAEVRMAGSLAYGQEDVEEAVRLIAAGQMKTLPLVSDVIRLDQVIEIGFPRMISPDKDIFRILVTPR